MSNVQGVSTTPSIVTDLEISGDPGAEMAALAVQSGAEQHRVARAARDAFEAVEQQEDAQEVQAMRQKAHDIECESWAEGLGMGVQGALDIGGAFSKKPTAWQGAGEVAHGISQVVGGGFRSAEASDDADAAAHKAASDRAMQAVEDMHDAEKGADGYASAALDFYRDYTSGEAQTRAAALHRA